jgi:hypothetical protein
MHADGDDQSDIRLQIDILASQSLQIQLRSQAITRGLGGGGDEAPPTRRRATAPQPDASPKTEDGSAETRECAVSFAVALKLDGIDRERAEALLVDEFGRQDAAEIADEAFGPRRHAA